MANLGIHGLHWVRYGIAGDQKYLLDEFAPGYDQLVIGANMVAHMPAAISTFVSQKAKKPFVIDPLTHAFQHGVENLLSTSKKSAGELKSSWSGLVKRYGDLLRELQFPRTITGLSFGEHFTRSPDQRVIRPEVMRGGSGVPVPGLWFGEAADECRDQEVAVWPLLHLLEDRHDA